MRLTLNYLICNKQNMTRSKGIWLRFLNIETLNFFPVFYTNKKYITTNKEIINILFYVFQRYKCPLKNSDILNHMLCQKRQILKSVTVMLSVLEVTNSKYTYFYFEIYAWGLIWYTRHWNYSDHSQSRLMNFNIINQWGTGLINVNHSEGNTQWLK